MNAVDWLGESVSPSQVRLVNRVLWALGLILLASAGIWFYYAIRAARESALASLAQCPLNQLALAFHNYHDMYGRFPPAYVTDAAGKPMHSWRALILPYMGEEELAAEYDFSEPWNGPHNSRLADLMPRTFHSPSEPPSTSHTNYVVIVGPDTAFPGATSNRMADFTDGLDETILAAEIATLKSTGSSRVTWTSAA